MFTVAHYWGLDEIGVFVVPAAIALWVLRRAERRAKKSSEEAESQK